MMKLANKLIDLKKNGLSACKSYFAQGCKIVDYKFIDFDTNEEGELVTKMKVSIKSNDPYLDGITHFVQILDDRVASCSEIF